jgi:hypothetical protein
MNHISTNIWTTISELLKLKTQRELEIKLEELEKCIDNEFSPEKSREIDELNERLGR